MLTDIAKSFQLDEKQLFRLNEMYSDVLKAKCLFFSTKDANKISVICVCSFPSL